MIKEKKHIRFLYWMIAGIITFLFIFLLVKLFPFYGAFFSFVWHITAPFVVACFFAYLLYPIINKIHSYGISKGFAILLIYLLVFGGGAYLSYRLYPIIIVQLKDFKEHLPQLLEMYETTIFQLYESTSFLPETVHDKIDQVINNVEQKLENLTGSLIGGVTKIFDMIVFLTVLPVIVFYLLKDYKKIKRYFLNYIPKKHRPIFVQIILGIDVSLGNYIRGQLLVCLFVSMATYLLFEIFNMDYSLLLAIIMGLTNLIPYFGPIIGAVPAVAIALTISGKMVIFVLISVFGIQLIEGNLISPYIVGKSVDIHPIAIIFVLLVGGKLAGIVGMILAVPMTTIIREIIRRIMIVKYSDE